VTLRRSIFLSDANAFVASNRALLSILDDLGRVFPDQTRPPDGGVYAFADVPAILGKRGTDMAALRESGLRRVYIGMETGSQKIREMVLKSGKPEDLLRAVDVLKSGGFEVGIVVLLGIGGKEYSTLHVEETARIINNMALGMGDILYFSPFYPARGSEYATSPETRDLKPLGKEGLRRQFQEIKKQLFFKDENQAPMISVYDIREFMV
jgi:hypothetical protein